MKKQKILFIIQAFPTEMSANTLCDEKIIAALQQTNRYEIHCLAYRYHWQPKEEVVNGVFVHRFSKGPWWDLYTWAKRRKPTFPVRQILRLNYLFMRCEQVLTIPIYPHTTSWITWLGYLHAKKLQKQYGFDLVVTEHHALDTTLAGYLLKKKFPHVKWMPIFWDALSGAIAPKYLPCKFSHKRRLKTEQRIFQQADCSIVMQAHYPLLLHFYKNVPLLNKIRPLDLPSFGQLSKDKEQTTNFNFNKDKIYLCFAGSLNNRNLKKLAAMLDKTNLPNIELLTVCGSDAQLRVQALAQKVHFPVRFLSYMPHRKLMQLLYQVDMFVHLGVNSNTMVASKIFEYMSFGKPIIATYKQDDDANLSYLKKYPLSFLLDERKAQDPAQINNLRSFIEQNVRKSVPYAEIAPVFYANTPQAYVEEINKLMGNL